LALVQHVLLWSYPLRVAREDGLMSARFARCLLSVALLPAAYGLAHALAPELFRLRSFAGALVLYLALTELINLPHHSDRPFDFSERLRPWEQWRAARSCAYPPLVAKLLLLNFNLHVEHHLFPTLPWHQLSDARAKVRPALGAAYVEATGAEWNLRNRSRDLHDVLLTAPAAPPT
jgi:acyl-lipid omega-6 desaturase (Delta-12 desaturase)